MSTDPGGRRSEGQCKIVVGTDSFTLRTPLGETRVFSYRDIYQMSAEGYRINVTIADGTRLELSALGHRYEDAARELHRARNEVIMADLLMGEKVRKQGVKGELRLPFRGAEGPCEIRLYDTALVLLPLRHALMRVRYSDIVGMEAKDHVLGMELESGERLVIAKLGRELDPLWKGISYAMAELDTNVQTVIKDLCPSLSGEELSSAARLMREGRAARRQDLEDISPALFPSLEARLRGQGLGLEYDNLVARGQKDLVRIGIKRSLVSDMEEDYIWFMVPLLGQAGNAVAMEVTSGPGGGRATYFFRIAPRSEYVGLDREAREEAAERCMDVLTAGLQDINFRRQPIYLADEKLLSPPFSRYRFSLMIMPSLRELRSLFIGRVAHTSPEEWAAKVDEVLAFNAKASGNERWSSGEEEAAQED